MSRPAWSILNPDKRYYSSADTDVRRTFARIRREQLQVVKKPDNDLVDAIRVAEESWRKLLK